VNFLIFFLYFSEPKQSHTTIAVVDHHSDGTYVLKALKQKLFVDGLCYLVQEIYGIENKNIDNAKVRCCAHVHALFSYFGVFYLAILTFLEQFVRALLANFMHEKYDVCPCIPYDFAHYFPGYWRRRCRGQRIRMCNLHE